MNCLQCICEAKRTNSWVAAKILFGRRPEGFRPGLSRNDAVENKALPHPDPSHEQESKREPPHPGPLLHKCVDEREMERRAQVLGISGRNSSGNSLRGPLHEHESKREPPHPDPLLHKCVEEREMERRTRVLGIHARNSSAKCLRGPLHEHESKREPPHPGHLLHTCVEEREMERRARFLGIHARNSSANYFPQEREQNGAALAKVTA
jgi:hypothetical protein